MTDRLVTFGDDDEVKVSVTSAGGLLNVKSGDASHVIEIVTVEAQELEILLDGKRMWIPFVRMGENIQFHYGGEIWTVEVSEAAGRRRGRHKEHSMSAPMPGAVLKIFVKPGDVVSKAAPLLILEAMKMEHQISAPYRGTVRAVHCQVGDLVQPGVDLISLERTPE